MTKSLMCSICKEEESSCDFCTRCSHHFHKECLLDWFRQDQFNCPLCRTLISSNQVVETFLNGKGIKDDILKMYPNDPLTKAFLQYDQQNVVKLVISSIFSENESDININVNEISSLGAVALLFSAREGYLDMVKYLVENGADLKVTDSEGFGLMHAAANNDRVDVVKYLLQVGASSCDINLQKESPLHMACEAGYFEVVKLLVASGVDLNTWNFLGTSALMKACSQGNLEIVDYLIKHGADMSGSLVCACHRGHFDIVKLLVESGVDVNYESINNEDDTPLSESFHHVEIFRYLLENGADLSSEGEELLEKACSEGHLELIKLLVESGVDVNYDHYYSGSPLVRACWAPSHSYSYSPGEVNIDAVRYLVEKGADISYIDHRGNSILDCAYTSSKNPALIKVLLEFANQRVPKFVFNDIISVTQRVCREGNLEVLKLLVEIGGVDINEKENEQNGYNLVQTAVIYGEVDILEYLLDLGVADLSVVDETGYNLLHLAVWYEQFEILKILIEKAGLDVDEGKNANDKRTPFNYACEEGHLEIAQYLLESGADLYAVDSGGCTALHNSAFKGQIQTVKYLLSKGVDINPFDERGKTPLDSALIFKKNEEVINYLRENGAISMKETVGERNL